MMEGSALTRCRFAPPPRFAERLGYRGDRRFVAVHWEPVGDEVTVRDDCSVAKGVGDRYVWADVFHEQRVRMGLRSVNVNLGNSDEAATHWLIIDRLTDDGFIASCRRGRSIIRQQRLTNLERRLVS